MTLRLTWRTISSLKTRSDAPNAGTVFPWENSFYGMDDSTFRIGVIVVAALLYGGTFGYSMLGFGGSSLMGASDEGRPIPPQVTYHDDDVDIYSTRSVRSSGTRGGGIRGGK